MLNNRLNWKKLASGAVIQGDYALLTEECALHIGYAFALWLAERNHVETEALCIAVGRDPRNGGAALQESLMHGLTAADLSVFDCGLCTTPAMYMTMISPKLQADAAIMVTGSHHTAEKNGFKFMLRDGEVTEEDILALLSRAQNTEVPERLVEQVDFLPDYAAYLKKVVHERLEDDARKPLLGLHVVVDAGNGSGGFFADMLAEMGADIKGSLNLRPDGRFPARNPDPENPEALKAVSEAVVTHGADLGVIFDPDCDRVAIVGENGRIIHRNRLIALIAAILLEEKPGATFVTDSVTSSGLAKFIAEWGGIHYRFKRGSQNVIDEAIRLNAKGIDCPLAIETSGHAAFRENFFLDDGMYLATRLICEALNRKREGQTLTSLIEELKEPVESVEIRMTLSGDDPREAGQAIIDTVLAHTLDDKSWKLAPDNREGVRIVFSLDGGIDNAWFQLRLSVHDPVLPLNAESNVPGGLKTILIPLYALLKDCEGLNLEPLEQILKEKE